MRVLFHAINGSGLGHLMRLSAISAELSSTAPEVRQLLLTGAFYPDHLRKLTVPYLVLPADPGTPFTGLNRRSRTAPADFNARLISDAALAFKADVVVSDTHASKVLTSRLRRGSRRAVLVFRKCRPEYLAEVLSNGFLGRFESIVVPHLRADFVENVPAALIRDLDALGSVHYVGPIVFPTRSTPERVAALERRLRLTPDERLVLIAAGAGGYGTSSSRMVELAARAALLVRERHPKLRVLCISGPFAREEHSLEGCEWLASEPELPLLMSRAELVVTHGGYNSVHEVLEVGARAVIVPLPRKNESQEERAAQLQARGRARSVSLDSTPAELAAVYEHVLALPRPQPETAPGARASVAEILKVAGGLRRWSVGVGPQSEVARWVAEPGELGLQLMRDASVHHVVRASVEQWGPAVKGAGPAAFKATWEIDVGAGAVGDLAERIQTALTLGTQLGVPFGKINFTYLDAEDGDQLPELAQLVSHLHFGVLVARVTSSLDGQMVRGLEAARALKSRFEIDVTASTDPVG